MSSEPVWSVNLTRSDYTRRLSDVEAALFPSPFFITSVAICVEVVFWSPALGLWVHLVRDYTGRVLPEHCTEVAALDIDPKFKVATGIS